MLSFVSLRYKIYLIVLDLCDWDLRDFSALVDEDNVVGTLRDDDDAGLVALERHLRDLFRDLLPVLCSEVVHLGEDIGLVFVTEDLRK